MADCKAKYRYAVNQFIRLVSVDAKAYVTFIKQVKEISLQYQTDLRDANIAEVRASVKHLDGRYFDQELAIEFDKPPQATQPGDAENWDEATRAAAERAYSYNEHRFEFDLGGKWNVANHWMAAPGVVT